MRRRDPWLHALADVVFPRACASCGRLLASDEAAWCRSCAETLLAGTAADCCPRCGLPVGPHLVDPAGCRECRGQSHPLDGMARVGHYADLAGELIKKYKYARRQELDRELGSLLAAAIQGQAWAGDLDALVPVPITWSSRLTYRFHPARLLAGCAGDALSLPVLPLLYVRGKKRKQTDLPASERPANVRGVFHVRRHARVSGATLCVVDDVCTSGATLREIARVLKRAGASRVYGAAIAMTSPTDVVRPPAEPAARVAP